MSIIKKVAAVLSAAVTVSAFSFLSAAEGNQHMIADMETAFSKAISYETNSNYYFARQELERYAKLADSLADAGEVSRKVADIAVGWRNQLEFSPELYIEDTSGDGVFFGSDGIFVEGSSAVKISVPFGKADVEGFYPLIPAVNDELCVLVALEPTNERMLRNIAAGKQDDYLIENLRQISRIEGRVYLAFCPSVNTWKTTRTVTQSFIAAYRYVAEYARRYAPNAELVYALGDVRAPGEDTVASFYPGNEYVDVFGVELCHTYNKSHMPSPEAAYDCRGEYYDPVFSVKQMVDEFADVVGDDSTPVMITGCSFPWDGKAAVSDWEAEMERFYRLIPAVCPTLTAVFYSNESSSMGVCNLRQNKQAFDLYKQCLELPWYVDHSRDDESGSASINGLTYMTPGESVYTALYCGGKFAGAEYRIFIDGSEISPEAAVFTAGKHSLAVYITDQRCMARLEYEITLTESGKFSADTVSAEYDYNRNGILDFGDTEMLVAYIAKWQVDLGDIDPDVNGDGKVNLADISVLRTRMSP